MGTTKRKKKYRWWGDVARPHERLATRILAELLERDARIVRQEAFAAGAELRVDMTADGACARYALPPKVARAAQQRRLLIEFESSRLSAARLQRMMAALLHAYMQDVDPTTRRWTPRPGEPSRPPMLVAYVRSASASVRSMLQTTDEPGVLHALIGLCDLYVIDNEQVARDSEYTHLRMMHAPRVDTAEEFLQTIEEMTRQVIHHAKVPWPMLERFMMSSFTELVRDEDQRESVYSKSLSQSYYEGVDDEKKRQMNTHANTQRRHALDLAAARRLRLDACSLERLEECKDFAQLTAWALWLAQQPRGTTVTLP